MISKQMMIDFTHRITSVRWPLGRNAKFTYSHMLRALLLTVGTGRLPGRGAADPKAKPLRTWQQDLKTAPYCAR
jgi:hypothetical protein